MPTINEIRGIVTDLLGKTFTPKSTDWDNVRSILKDHATWGTRLDDITGIRFKIGKMNNAPQMWLRTKGKTRWFIASWQRCGTNFKQPEKRSISSAMRYAVLSQTQAFSNMSRVGGNWRCNLCNVIQQKLEVDHYPLKFDVIMREFLENENDIPSQFNYSLKTGVPRFRPTDKNFKTRWQRAHKQRATYRLLCRRCNASTNQL